MFNKKYAKGGVLRGGSGEDYVPEIGETILPIRCFFAIDAAIDYIKGYCNKHPNCSKLCRLYDIEGEHCMFFDTYGILGLPCDWKMPKREEEEDEK